MCELVHTSPDFSTLSASADVGRGTVEPAPRCLVAPARDREARARIHVRTGTVDRRMACRGIAHAGVMHRCGACRRAEDDQEAHGQNAAHRIGSHRATVPADVIRRPSRRNLTRLHSYEMRRQRSLRWRQPARHAVADQPVWEHALSRRADAAQGASRYSPLDSTGKTSASTLRLRCPICKTTIMRPHPRGD